MSVPRDPYGVVCRRVVEPLAMALRGDRSRRLVPRVEAALSLPRAEMERDLRERLAALLAHARETVPFWKTRLAAAGLDVASPTLVADLAQVPPLTRAEAAAEPAAMLSRDFPVEGLVEIRTGGSTGEPAPFLQSREMVAEKDAAAIALRSRMGWRPGARRAYLWGASQDAPVEGGGFVSRTRRRFVARFVDRSLYLPAGNVSEARLDDYAERLRRFRPLALQAYPSAADLLARRLSAKGEHLEVPIVLLTAEPVHPDQRERVAAAFGADVFTFYGARECGWIASECAGAHRLHVNTAGVHVDVDAGGRLLVTDLVNRAMPLVRYVIGDRGAMDPAPCPCGDARPVLARLEGRVNDVLLLPSGRRIPAVAFDRTVRFGLGIVEWQIVQDERAALDVRYVPAPAFDPKNLDTLRQRLDETFAGELSIRFHRAERIEPEANGKVRACIVRVRPPAGTAP